MTMVLAVSALVGLSIGSFLTVVVSRYGTEETIVSGRSRCPSCRRILHWFELLPALSFIAQGGRCRSCRAPIPPLYLVIELACGFLFIFAAHAVFYSGLRAPVSLFLDGLWPGSGAVFSFLYFASFLTSAVAVSAYDWLHRLVPRAFLFPPLFIALAAIGGDSLFRKDPAALWPPLVAAALAFGFFWLLWRFSKGQAMGRGDADVAGLIGLYLGPAQTLFALLISFWAGAIFGILLVALGKLDWKSQVPFAPFLFGGALVSLIVGVPDFVALLFYGF